MKKLLFGVLIIALSASLFACNKKEEENLVGGYTEVEDGAITAELQEIFDKASEGLVGATYTPKELVATQVVAGTNYKFLCDGVKTTNPPVKGEYYVTVYKDLKGNCSIGEIEVISEK